MVRSSIGCEGTGRAPFRVCSYGWRDTGGIEITREQDDAKAEELEVWLDKVLASYGVLSMDAPVFREWARLMHRKSKHDHRRRDDRGNSHRVPADCGHSECE